MNLTGSAVMNKSVDKGAAYRFCVAIIMLAVLAAGCNRGGGEPQVFRAKSSIVQGFTDPSLNQTDSLTFRTDETRAVRKDEVAVPISDISVSATRVSGSGVLPYEAYLSATFIREADFFYGHTSGASGDVDWLKSHLHQLAIAAKANYLQHSEDYDYEPTDTTINLAPLDNPNSPLHPVYYGSGASYFARLDRADDLVPWNHPDVNPASPDPNCFTSSDPDVRCIDMQTITRLLFTGLSGAVSGAVGSMGPIMIPGSTIPLGTAALGGPNSDGDFKLWFIPQAQFNEDGGVNESKLRKPGIGLIFEGTIRINAPVLPVGYASLKAYIPIFIVADRFSGTDLLMSFQVQPFEDLIGGVTPAFGIDKLVILANTPLGILGQDAATRARTAIIAALTALPTTSPQLAGMLFGADAALELGINKFINKNRDVAHPSDFDLITLPTQCVNRIDLPLCFEYNGIISTRVQPEDGSHTPVALFILER